MAIQKFKNKVRVEAEIEISQQVANRALVTNASKELVSSSVTDTELGHLSGVTSNVQSQINTAQTDINNHIADTVDAHDASAISNIPSGNLAATDVQGALNELQSDVDARIPLSQKGASNGVATLDAGGKVPVAQLPSSVMTYEGVWNAATNTPSLADGVGDAGMVYRVGTAGTQNLGSGSISFEVGDYVIYNGTIWEKSDTTDAVASVFGRTGIVTAQSGDYSASQITNTPAGTIAATTVQAAINELDGDIALKANQSLNNLTATSINQSLLPDASGARSLGSVTRSFTTVFATRYAAAGATVALAGVTGTSGSTSVTVTSTAGIIGGSVYSIFVPSLNVKVLIATVVDGTTLTLASALPQTITGETAFAIPNFIGRTENETGANPSGDGIVRSGNTASGKSGDVSILSGSASSSGATGDVRVASGTTAGTRGRVILDGREISASSREIKNVANGTTSDAAVNKSQLDAVAATIPARSAGDIAETSFSLANNQTVAANVTGFLFSNAVVRSFKALVSVQIDATTDSFEAFELLGIQKGAGWDMAVTSTGDDSGIVFSITSSGQIQYTSTNNSGFVSGAIRFRAETTSL